MHVLKAFLNDKGWHCSEIYAIYGTKLARVKIMYLSDIVFVRSKMAEQPFTMRKWQPCESTLALVKQCTQQTIWTKNILQNCNVWVLYAYWAPANIVPLSMKGVPNHSAGICRIEMRQHVYY